MPDAARQYGVHHAPPLGDDQALAIVAPSRPPTRRSSRSVANDSPGSASRRVFPTADPDRDEPASPAARAADIEDAFADPEIGAVMAYTGGDDQIRVLRHLDGDALAASPTRFFGYSDNDNLRLFLWNRGIVSYGLGVHPDLVCDADLHTYTERYLRRALFEESLGRIVPADEWTDDWFDFEAREPRASGTIPPARRCGWGRRETPPNRSAVGCGAGRSRS